MSIIKDLESYFGSSTADDVASVKSIPFDVKVTFTSAELTGHRVTVEKVINLPSPNVYIENVSAIKRSGLGYFSILLSKSSISQNSLVDVFYEVIDVSDKIIDEIGMNYFSSDQTPRLWVVVTSYGTPLEVEVQISGLIR